MSRNKLYFGDNLEVMREMEDESVDLIATDPPFNSGRNYNMFLEGSKAQKKAFTDIWEWDDTAIEAREEISYLAKENKSYYNLEQALLGYDLLLQKAIRGENSKIRSYLAFMGPRLVEMYRLLKDTGSLYLHCDQIANHYLKGLLDCIFGKKHFQNEIIWSYRTGGVSKKHWPRKHDTLLFYIKSQVYQHKPLQERIYYEKPFFGIEKDEQDRYYADVFVRDVWEDIKPLINLSKERTGYPTQKPRALYERIIKVSSNETDIVLDPFAGCGTTLDAAQQLNRNWIGIDITVLSLEPMQKRLLDNHSLQSGIDYEIVGYPTNMQEVMKLVKDKKKYNDFANWAVTRLGLKPTADSNDGGFDGTAYTRKWIPKGMQNLEATILAEVKTGSISKQAVRAFCQSMNDQEATAGIIVSFNKPTKAMREYQERLGTFEHNNKPFHKLQFWQIDERYFENPESVNQQIKLPWQLRKVQKDGTSLSETQLQLL